MHVVYLAADAPLREVAWDKAAPAFNTTPLAPDELRVRRQFSKQHLIYAGSHEGCGCGFQLGEYPPEYTEPDEIAQRRGSLHEFAAYLREELSRVGMIQVFACWDGDQEAPPEHHRRLTPSAIETDSFFLSKDELTGELPSRVLAGGTLRALDGARLVKRWEAVMRTIE